MHDRKTLGLFQSVRKATGMIFLLLLIMMPIMSSSMALASYSPDGTVSSSFQDYLNSEKIQQLKDALEKLLSKNEGTIANKGPEVEMNRETYLLHFSGFEERDTFLRLIEDVINSQKKPIMFKVSHVYKNFPVILVEASSRIVHSFRQVQFGIIHVASNEPMQMTFDPRELLNGNQKGSTSEISRLEKVSFSLRPWSRGFTEGVIDVVGLQQFDSQLDLDTIPAQVTKADKLWEMGYKGKGVKIAIADTGIWADHPDLNVALVRNYVSPAYGYSQSEDANDGHGHGTHVAGIAAGTGLASGGKYVGMAPEATLYSLKVATTFGSATPAGLLAAIDDAIALGVDVLSISLGFSSGDADDIISQAVDRAVEAGVVVTVSAGNSGPSYFTVTSPATARKVISVGASTYDRKVGEFSSRGPTPDGRVDPDVLAPGVEVISTLSRDSVLDEALSALEGYDGIIRGDGGDYIPLTGTSMAAPVVAGAAALLRQAFPLATALEIKAAIQATAVKLTHVQGIHATGNGFLDVLAAYDYLLSSQGQITFVQPDVLEFVDPPQFSGESASMIVSVISSSLSAVSLRLDGNISSMVTIPSTIELDKYGYGEFSVNVSIPFFTTPGQYVGTIELLDSQGKVVSTISFNPLEIRQPKARILWDLWHNDFADSFLVNFHELQKYLEEELGYSLISWDKPWNLHELLQFDLIVLPDPEIALTPHDRAVLSAYLYLGGNAIFLSSYGPNFEVNSLNEFLRPVGIQFSSAFIPSTIDQGLDVGFTDTEVGVATLNASFFTDRFSKISWPLGSKMEVSVDKEGTEIGAYVTLSSSPLIEVPVIAQVNLSSFTEYPFSLSLPSVVSRQNAATKPGKIVVISSELIWYDWHWLSQNDVSSNKQFTKDLLQWILKPTIDKSMKLLSSNVVNLDWDGTKVNLYLNATETLTNQTITATMRIFDSTTNSYDANSLPTSLTLLVLNESSVVFGQTVAVDATTGIAKASINPGAMTRGWYVVGVAVNDTRGNVTGLNWKLLHVRNAGDASAFSLSLLSNITATTQGIGTSRPSDWTSIIESDELESNPILMYKGQQISFTMTVNVTSEFVGINAMVFEIGEGLSSLIVRNLTTFVTFEELTVRSTSSSTTSQRVYEATWDPPSQVQQGQYLLLVEVIENWNGTEIVSDQQGFTFFVYEDQPVISTSSSTFNDQAIGTISTTIQLVSVGQEIPIQLSGDDPSDPLSQMHAEVLFIHFYFFVMTTVILKTYELEYSSASNSFRGTFQVPNQDSLTIGSDDQQLRLKTGNDQLYALIYVLRDSQGNYAIEVVPLVIQGNGLSLLSSAGFVIVLLLLIVIGALFLYFWHRSRKASSSRAPMYPSYARYQRFQYQPPQMPPPAPSTVPPQSSLPQKPDSDESLGVADKVMPSGTRKFCRYCGFSVLPSDAFCGNCGKKL